MILCHFATRKCKTVIIAGAHFNLVHIVLIVCCGIVTNSEDPDEMPFGISSGSTLFAQTKTIFRERNAILFRNNNL